MLAIAGRMATSLLERALDTVLLWTTDYHYCGPAKPGRQGPATDWPAPPQTPLSAAPFSSAVLAPGTTSKSSPPSPPGSAVRSLCSRRTSTEPSGCQRVPTAQAPSSPCCVPSTPRGQLRCCWCNLKTSSPRACSSCCACAPPTKSPAACFISSVNCRWTKWSSSSSSALGERGRA